MEEGNMRKGTKWTVVLIAACMFLGATAFCQAAQEPKKLQLKLQTHLIPVDSERVITRFVEAVSALSGGQMEIKWFPVGAIVPMKEVLNTVSSGGLDMALVGEGYWHKLVPASELAGIPFAFRDIAEARDFMLNRGFGDLLKQGYAKYNIYHIPYETYPVGLMTNRPINKAEDIKGMKLRAYGVMAEWLTELGASTTYIPGGELYTALATGVVDGCHWGDAGPMYVMKLHEVLKNYMKPEPIVGAWNNLLVNMDVWKKLTPVQKSIMENAAMAQGLCWSTNTTRILAKTSLRKMVADWNVKVNVLPEEEVEKMTQAAMVVWDKLADKDPVNAKIIGMLKDYLRELGYMK
jgi:TRAP-type C4-dicarboxylate transport system substrate-binding protein